MMHFFNNKPGEHHFRFAQATVSLVASTGLFFCATTLAPADPPRQPIRPTAVRQSTESDSPQTADDNAPSTVEPTDGENDPDTSALPDRTPNQTDPAKMRPDSRVDRLKNQPLDRGPFGHRPPAAAIRSDPQNDPCAAWRKRIQISAAFLSLGANVIAFYLAATVLAARSSDQNRPPPPPPDVSNSD